MAGYDNIRLETTGGTVVAYLAPNFEIKPTLKNDLFSESATEGKQVVRDNQIIQSEIVAQGEFEHSDNLPADHRNALSNVFGSLPVTPRQQVNRVKHYALFEGGPFHFYDNGDQYTATDMTNVNLQSSPATYPAVQIDEFRPPAETTPQNSMQYMLKMKVGVSR